MGKEKAPTPFMAQYLGVKEAHPDKLVLFRMGDFFEIFYDDAKTASSILGITLTSRHSKSDNPTPMAGIPHHSLGDYLPKLIAAGLKVAICDQVENPAEAKGIVKREVVRVVTKGTITEDSLLNPGRNNYLLALMAQSQKIVLAYLDLSTGEIIVRNFKEAQVIDFLNALAPGEILISRSFEKLPLAQELKSCLDDSSITALDDWNFALDSGRDKVLAAYQLKHSEGLGLEMDSPYFKPLGALLEYLEQTQMSKQFHLRRIQTVNDQNYMILDRQSHRNLELFRNQQDGGIQGSLYEALNQMSTPMGSRRLASWMTNPLLNQKELEERFDAVEAFNQMTSLEDFSQALGKIRDLERPLGRVRCGRFSPRDMKSLCESLAMVPKLNELLNEKEELQHRRPKECPDLVEKLQTCLRDELPLNINLGDVIRDGVDEKLDEWRQIRDGGKAYLHDLQERLKVELELPGLKVRHNKVFGYYIEVPKAQSAKVPEHFIRKQTLVNAERYIIGELKEFEDKIFSANDKVLEIEERLVNELRVAILEMGELIMEVAVCISELDVLSSFALLAKRYSYIRPLISEEPKIHLKNARHPVVERILGLGEFCPNGIGLSRDEVRMMLLTGPNMAGKSTYIRQVGLIQIMFQMGCFIPADEGELSLVDRVFTRVGAGDDLSSGRSTFMVEMNETANILHNATPRSLVILDEVGRGTSTLDGLSLAWSITEDLHNRKELSPLCLFATHYHEMTALEKTCSHLKNFQVQVEERGDRIIFLHRIIAGGADKSYGIHVARLAGLPDRVIKRSKELLHVFEGDQDLSGDLQIPEAKDEEPSFLFDFKEQDGELKRKLAEIEPDEITPLQALIFLKELKDIS